MRQSVGLQQNSATFLYEPAAQATRRVAFNQYTVLDSCSPALERPVASSASKRLQNQFPLQLPNRLLVTPRGSAGTPFPAFPSLEHSLPHLLLFYTFSFFSRSLNLFSSFVHPFPFYQKSHLYLAPPLKVTPLEFRRNLWHQYGVVCVILDLAVLVELRLVTDRQTDRKGYSL